jgi:hypothetical protein
MSYSSRPLHVSPSDAPRYAGVYCYRDTIDGQMLVYASDETGRMIAGRLVRSGMTQAEAVAECAAALLVARRGHLRVVGGNRAVRRKLSLCRRFRRLVAWFRSGAILGLAAALPLPGTLP